MALVNFFTRRGSSKKTGVNETLQGVDLKRPLYHSRVFKQFRNERGFNKRYFALYPGFILYYKHERDFRDHVKGGKKNFKMLNLNGVYLKKVEHPPDPKIRFCFMMHTPDPLNHRNEMLLVVKTRRQYNYWLVYIQAQNPNLLPPEETNTERPSPPRPIQAQH